MLEMANYIAIPSALPEDYLLGTYQLPADVPTETWQVDQLPDNWDACPYRWETQRLGTRWLAEAKAALLFVPSAAVPGGLESNVVYNPPHPDAYRLELIASERRIYSDRMFAGT